MFTFIIYLMASLGIKGTDAFNLNRPNYFLSMRPKSPTVLNMAVWSNGQAVKEYQDFLISGKQNITLAKDCPSVIVSSISKDSPSSLLVEGILSLGKGEDLVLTSDSPLPTSLGEQDSYPIYVALPPNELDDFIKNLSDDWKPRQEDFVFLSGGRIAGVVEPTLRKYGYARDTMTQMLVSGMALSSKAPTDLSCIVGTDASGKNKWAGECAACGKWCGAVQERLERNDIRCKAGFYRDWRRYMWERAIFDAVFNLVGCVRKEKTDIQEVVLYYEEEASEMMVQVTKALRGMLAVTLLYGYEERLMGYAEQRGELECQLNSKMYPYTFCYPIGPTSMVAEYLNYAKDKMGLLQDIEVPNESK